MINSFKKIIKRAKAARQWVKDNRQLLLLMLAIVIMLILGGCYASEHEALLSIIIGGVAGGKHITGEPLTTDLTREASPELLLNEIDQQIVKIRPMATPIDQLSRHAGAKHSGSMIVDYYNVDTKPTSTEMAQDYEERHDYRPRLLAEVCSPAIQRRDSQPQGQWCAQRGCHRTHRDQLPSAALPHGTHAHYTHVVLPQLDTQILIFIELTLIIATFSCYVIEGVTLRDARSLLVFICSFMQ